MTDCGYTADLGNTVEKPQSVNSLMSRMLFKKVKLRMKTDDEQPGTGDNV